MTIQEKLEAYEAQEHLVAAYENLCSAFDTPEHRADDYKKCSIYKCIEQIYRAGFLDGQQTNA